MKNIPLRFLVITFCLTIFSLTFSFNTINSQVKPLTLAQVLTGLQSKSGGFSLAEKNDFITKKVQQSGVTFRLTPEIEKELKQVGASTDLIRMIRIKAPRTRPTPVPSTIPDDEKPSAELESIRVEQNVVEDGVKGIRIYSNFSVYNLKGIQSDIVFRIQKDGKWLQGSTADYKTTTGDLSARRYLKPDYSATVYDDLAAFLPYSEINLSPGTYDLKLDADVILRDGTIVKHLTLQDLRLVIPSPTLKKGSATFSNLWVDYSATQNGMAGMIVHVKLSVRDLKDESLYIQVLVGKDDGTKLFSSNSNYRSQSGQTAAYKLIRPNYDSTNFNDVAVFIPFQEFNLPIGKYNLKLDVDLVYSDYTLLSHLTFHPFTYTRSK